MNNFNEMASKILDFLFARFPEPSDLMMLEIVENFADRDQYEAFVKAMNFLESDGYLTYQYSTFGMQHYSMVILTEKGLAFYKELPESIYWNKN